MTLEETIKLFQALELGQTPAIGYHLHRSITKALNQKWETNQNHGDKFSEFLIALADEPFPKL